MLKVSAGCPPPCGAACTGTVSSLTNAPTSKKAKSKLLVFDSGKHSIDWLNSLIIRSLLCSNFIVYFLSLHVGLALLIKARLRLFWFELLALHVATSPIQR